MRKVSFFLSLQGRRNDYISSVLSPFRESLREGLWPYSQKVNKICQKSLFGLLRLCYKSVFVTMISGKLEEESDAT